eukprot:785624_1
MVSFCGRSRSFDTGPHAPHARRLYRNVFSSLTSSVIRTKNRRVFCTSALTDSKFSFDNDPHEPIRQRKSLSASQALESLMNLVQSPLEVDMNEAQKLVSRMCELIRGGGMTDAFLSKILEALFRLSCIGPNYASLFVLQNGLPPLQHALHTRRESQAVISNALKLLAEISAANSYFHKDIRPLLKGVLSAMRVHTSCTVIASQGCRLIYNLALPLKFRDVSQNSPTESFQDEEKHSKECRAALLDMDILSIFSEIISAKSLDRDAFEILCKASWATVYEAKEVSSLANSLLSSIWNSRNRFPQDEPLQEAVCCVVEQLLRHDKCRQLFGSITGPRGVFSVLRTFPKNVQMHRSYLRLLGSFMHPDVAVDFGDSVMPYAEYADTWDGRVFLDVLLNFKDDAEIMAAWLCNMSNMMLEIDSNTLNFAALSDVMIIANRFQHDPLVCTWACAFIANCFVHPDVRVPEDVALICESHIPEFLLDSAWRAYADSVSVQTRAAGAMVNAFSWCDHFEQKTFQDESRKLVAELLESDRLVKLIIRWLTKNTDDEYLVQSAATVFNQAFQAQEWAFELPKQLSKKMSYELFLDAVEKHQHNENLVLECVVAIQNTIYDDEKCEHFVQTEGYKRLVLITRNITKRRKMSRNAQSVMGRMLRRFRKNPCFDANHREYCRHKPEYLKWWQDEGMHICRGAEQKDESFVDFIDGAHLDGVEDGEARRKA